MDMKTCTKCGIEKDRSEFGARKDARDGLRSNCKSCVNIGIKQWTEKNKQSVAAKHAEYYIKNSDRIKQAQRDYYHNNKEAKQLKAKEWHKNNPEKAIAKNKKWRDKNKQAKKDYDRTYGQNNPDKITAKRARRRAAKLQATPPWLTEEDFVKIRMVYAEAKRLQKLDGIKRHVDHIIPLQGETVCGLHIFENLQILTEHENCSKSNKLDQ